VTSPSLDSRAESLFRELAPQVLGCVNAMELRAAEDAVQEALIAAPFSSRATGFRRTARLADQVASRRMTDHWRSGRRASAARGRGSDALLHPPRASRTRKRRIQAMTRFFSCSCVAIPR
jgi:DNA-directed RNA polymerase specialized sigma24 family protein